MAFFFQANNKCDPHGLKWNYINMLTNTHRCEQNGWYFANDIFNCILFNGNNFILLNLCAGDLMTSTFSAQKAINTLRPRQNSSHFANDISICIFLNENAWISIKISLNFVPKRSIFNIPSLYMAWCQPGNKPSSHPMVVSLLMHICITRRQWVKVVKNFMDFKSIKNSLHVNALATWKKVTVILQTTFSTAFS